MTTYEILPDSFSNIVRSSALRPGDLVIYADRVASADPRRDQIIVHVDGKDSCRVLDDGSAEVNASRLYLQHYGATATLVNLVLTISCSPFILELGTESEAFGVAREEGEAVFLKVPQQWFGTLCGDLTLDTSNGNAHTVLRHLAQRAEAALAEWLFSISPNDPALDFFWIKYKKWTECSLPDLKSTSSVAFDKAKARLEFLRSFGHALQGLLLLMKRFRAKSWAVIDVGDRFNIAIQRPDNSSGDALHRDIVRLTFQLFGSVRPSREPSRPYLFENAAVVKSPCVMHGLSRRETGEALLASIAPALHGYMHEGSSVELIMAVVHEKAMLRWWLGSDYTVRVIRSLRGSDRAWNTDIVKDLIKANILLLSAEGTMIVFRENMDHQTRDDLPLCLDSIVQISPFPESERDVRLAALTLSQDCSILHIHSYNVSRFYTGGRCTFEFRNTLPWLALSLIDANGLMGIVEKYLKYRRPSVHLTEPQRDLLEMLAKVALEVRRLGLGALFFVTMEPLNPNDPPRGALSPVWGGDVGYHLGVEPIDILARCAGLDGETLVSLSTGEMQFRQFLFLEDKMNQANAICRDRIEEWVESRWQRVRAAIAKCGKRMAANTTELYTMGTRHQKALRKTYAPDEDAEPAGSGLYAWSVSSSGAMRWWDMGVPVIRLDSEEAAEWSKRDGME